jgi:hypothetical protein
VDCEIYKSLDVTASDTAKMALLQSAEDASPGTKTTMLVCKDRCGINLGVKARPATNADALFAHLWIDLCGQAFERIGRVLARRWGE